MGGEGEGAEHGCIAGCMLLARTATNHTELKIFNAEEQQNNNRRPVKNYR